MWQGFKYASVHKILEVFGTGMKKDLGCFIVKNTFWEPAANVLSGNTADLLEQCLLWHSEDSFSFKVLLKIHGGNWFSENITSGKLAYSIHLAEGSMSRDTSIYLVHM